MLVAAVAVIVFFVRVEIVTLASTIGEPVKVVVFAVTLILTVPLAVLVVSSFAHGIDRETRSQRA